MPLDVYLAFLAASAALIAMPGPNVALIVANSLAHGARYGLLTVAGTSSAMVLQLAVTVAGATTVLTLLADWFELLRWIGVVYLVVLGIRAWRAPAEPAAVKPQPKSVRTIYLRGFLVSLTNPKTLLFYGAFLPQFVTDGADAQNQLMLLAASFLALAIVMDGMWALLAGRLRGVVSRAGRLANRLTGGLLIGAGLGLALARKP